MLGLHLQHHAQARSPRARRRSTSPSARSSSGDSPSTNAASCASGSAAICSRLRRRCSARNQSSADVLAIPSSQVRVLPRSRVEPAPDPQCLLERRRPSGPPRARDREPCRGGSRTRRRGASPQPARRSVSLPILAGAVIVAECTSSVRRRACSRHTGCESCGTARPRTASPSGRADPGARRGPRGERSADPCPSSSPRAAPRARRPGARARSTRFSTCSSSVGARFAAGFFARRRARGSGGAGGRCAASASRRSSRSRIEIGPAAVVRAQPAILDRDDAVRDRVEHRPVVRHEQDRARERLERGLQRLTALEVEMVRRLVEHEQVGSRRDEQARARAAAAHRRRAPTPVSRASPSPRTGTCRAASGPAGAGARCRAAPPPAPSRSSGSSWSCWEK